MTGIGTGPSDVESTFDRGDPTERRVSYIDSVYDELRGLAAVYLQQPSHTLQPTALVHEAYLRLSSCGAAQWHDRTHFLAVAARAMRQILVDHARKKATRKRGRGQQMFTLADSTLITSMKEVDILVCDDALAALTALDERKGRVVELRVFGGLTIDETADFLGVSSMTVSKDWRFARAWLAREFDPE